jgi:hypothetical protein
MMTSGCSFDTPICVLHYDPRGVWEHDCLGDCVLHEAKREGLSSLGSKTRRRNVGLVEILEGLLSRIEMACSDQSIFPSDDVSKNV